NRHGHPRPARGLVRRPRRLPGRRPDRPRAGLAHRGDRPRRHQGDRPPMTKVAIKGLALHKTRAVLTTLAVVIGVAMISGAYVVSDTMLSAAKSLSGSAYDNTDAVVTKKQAFDSGSDTVGTAVTVTPAVLQKVRSMPQVA